jgi:multidrug efflux pump subunit AcrA (membrane-fusion protein)
VSPFRAGLWLLAAALAVAGAIALRDGRVRRSTARQPDCQTAVATRGTVAGLLRVAARLEAGSDPRRLRMELPLDERYLNGIQPGPATFRTPSLGDYELTAAVDGVVPLGDARQSPRPFAVVLSVANGDGALRPGMTAAVDLPVTSTRATLAVPVRALHSGADAALVGFGALATEPDATFVLVADGAGRAIPLRVEVGVTNGELAEVTGAGVAAGRVLVADPRPSACAVATPVSPFGAGEP